MYTRDLETICARWREDSQTKDDTYISLKCLGGPGWRQFTANQVTDQTCMWEVLF